MTGSGPRSVSARIRPGIRAGATTGLLSGLCSVFLFSGLDFSSGNPLAPLFSLPLRQVGLWVGFVAVGAALGAVLSWRSP